MGTDLVLRDLTAHSDRTFADVIEYSLSRDGKTLAYAVASAKEESDGVYAVVTNTATSAGALRTDAARGQRKVCEAHLGR